MNKTYNVTIPVSVSDILYDLSQKESLQIIREMAENHDDWDYNMDALNQCLRIIDSGGLFMDAPEIKKIDFNLLERVYKKMERIRIGS